MALCWTVWLGLGYVETESKERHNCSGQRKNVIEAPWPEEMENAQTTVGLDYARRSQRLH